jgi:very-short-patch-repair endonuclease
VRLIIVWGGLPRPVAQFEVVADDGANLGRVDLAYPLKKVGIEYEGAYHRESAAFQRDLQRINRMIAAGWTILRFGPRDVFQTPRGLLDQVRRAIG